MIMDAGADLSQLDDQGETPLNTAGRYNSHKVLQVVLSYGERFLDITNKKGGTVLHDAAFRRSTKVIDFVLSSIAKERAKELVGKEDNSGFLPLHLACVSGDLDSVRLLLGAGVPAHINASSLDGQTPLMIAVSNRRMNLVELLLAGGASVSAPTSYGATALHMAASRGMTGTILALLEAGADANAADELGKTPLHGVTTAEAALALLEAGADPDAQSTRRVTPLHLAARLGRVDVVRVLLDYGVDAGMKSEGGRFDGFSAKMFAMSQGHEEIVDMLP